MLRKLFKIEIHSVCARLEYTLCMERMFGGDFGKIEVGNSYFSVLIILIFIAIEVSFLVWGKGETWWNVNFRKINESWCHVENFTWERTKLVTMGTTVSGIKRAEKGLTYFRPWREYEVWKWVVVVIAINLLKWKWIGPFGWGRRWEEETWFSCLSLG